MKVSQNQRLALLKTLSLLSLVAERTTRALWRLASWMVFFAALWLLEIPGLFGTIGSVLTLLTACAGCAYFIYKDALSFRWLSALDVLRHIERQSEAAHRPLSSLSDHPVGHDKDDPLWQREQTRRRKLLNALRPYMPQAFLAQQDPRALRLGAALLFICALLVAGTHWQSRIYNGLTPFHWEPRGITTNTLSVWITPPDYTRHKRIVLTPGHEEALHIPQGSTLKVITQKRLSNTLITPSVRIDEQSFPMHSAEDGAYMLEREIPEGAHLKIRTELLRSYGWTYEYIPDHAPAIYTEPAVKILSNGQFQPALSLFDDYGVQTLDLRMTLDPSVETRPKLGWPAEEQRSVMSPPGQHFQINPVYDLSAHPWAGLPVILTFTARDHLDQIAQSEPIRITLPQRRFSHPVAQEIIRIRERLIANPQSPYQESILALDEVRRFPQNFNHDRRIFLALSIAAARLYHNAPSLKITESTIALLWNTALRLEDGNLSLAAQDLRDIQRELEQAIQDPNISEAKIAALMQKLREAMAEYIQAMAREWQKQAEQNKDAQPLPPEILANMMSMNDLANLLDKMEADMLSGDRNAAQDMLSKLQRLLDMVNPSANAELPPDMQMMFESLGALQDLIERQEKLLAKTEEHAALYNMLEGLNAMERGGAPPFMDMQSAQDEQSALRDELGSLIDQAGSVLSQIPENFNMAREAMDSAASALKQGRPNRAVPFQKEALEQLNQSQQQMAQQLAQKMQQMTGMSLSGRPLRYDPLGRASGFQDGKNGAAFGSQVKIPSESERKRVQDILNELRRRASQRGRPHEELEYYRRLLKRF